MNPSPLLIPFGKIYGHLMDARNALYDRGIFRVYDLGARTISVGNLTTGGTGKTPLVAAIAEILAENGQTVCILTRGYGRRNARDRVVVSDGETILTDAVIGGDEPVELARKLVGKAIIIADRDRLVAGRWALEKFGITAFILDDGFQHRRVKRDLNIVCIDATDPRGNGRILPAGTLRESFNSLTRADAIVLTRTNLVDSTDDVIGRLRKWNPVAPIFGTATRITAVTKLDDFLAGRPAVDGEQGPTFPEETFGFCGLGNPENFRSLLEKAGVQLSGFMMFNDHMAYSSDDVRSIEIEAERSGATALLTTAKDAVKLVGSALNLPVFVVEIEPIIDDPYKFRDLVISSS
jgi:tetraacyldisaccharide 4'-kinase